MSVVGNIKVMSEGVSGLTKQVKALHAEIKAMGGDASTTFKSLKGLFNTGGQLSLGQGSSGNVLGSSLGSFSTAFSGNAAASMGVLSMGAGAMQALGGVAQIVAAPIQGAYAATMDTSGIVQRAGSYYQAALRSPGLTRNSLERATFSALGTGMTGVGSDAAVANILANAGYVPGSTDYLSAVRQVGGAATYLGMSNQNAANAIAGLQSGGMGANLYQYGISTMNTNGTSKSVGDIARQLYSVMFPNGASAAGVQNSIRSGYAGLNMQGMGMTADQQQMMTQAMIDIASGKNPDLNPSVKGAVGNKNPFDAMYQMNSSQTGIQAKSEKNALTGLDAAAKTVTLFNNAMGDVIASMATFKGYMDGISGTNAGKGIKKTASGLWSGIKNVLSGIGTVVVGAAMLGGGTPGYGGSFGGTGRPRGGGTPGSSITAGYGATDSSGIWASTGNTHLGTDYDVPVGTPVMAVMDGIVSNQTLSSDYGNAVLIDHPNGYSTVYAHLSNKEVSPGKQVFKGQEIGKSGKSGNVTGPHLHFEVRKGANNPVDPSTLQNAIAPVSDGFGGGSATALAQQYLMANGMSSSGYSGGLPTNTNLSTKAQKAWANSLLKALGAPATSNNVNSITTWMRFEGGLNHNNPLNTTLDASGATLWNSEGVKTYGTLAQGTQATVDTLTGNQSKARGYDAIVSALKQGNAPTSDVLQLINQSSWGTKIHGGGTPGYGAHVPTSATLAPASPTMTSAVSSGAKNVYITLKIDQASEQDAVVFAKRVQAILDQQNDISVIGSR